MMTSFFLGFVALGILFASMAYGFGTLFPMMLIAALLGLGLKVATGFFAENTE